MMKVNIEDLKTILSQTSFGIKVNDLVAEDDLRKQGVDSLDMLDFYLNIEEKYEISIPDKDAEKLNSLNDFESYINDKI